MNKFFKKIGGTFRKKSAPSIREFDISEELPQNIERLIYGDERGWRVSPQSAYQYFAKVHSLRDSVDKIVDAIKDLQLGVLDESNNLDSAHAALEVLKSPGAEMSASDLIGGMAESKLLTGEAWLILRGNVNRPPVAASYVRSYNIAELSTLDRTNGFPFQLRTDSPRDERTYTKQEIGGRIRYFDDKELNEIVPIIGTRDIVDQFRGLSPLTSIKKELDQIWYGNVHNSTMLEKGMTISVLLWLKEATGVTVFNEVVAALKEQFTGADRSSGIFVAPQQLEKADLTFKNKDADYINLIKTADTRIYSLFDIPLPLIFPDQMNLSNYKAAQEAFYDRAVVRAFTSLFTGISSALAVRYGFDNLKIGFNPHAVKALQQRQAERMETLRKTQSLGTNEIRQTAGYGKPESDDPVMIAANLVPLGVDSEFPPDEPDKNFTANHDPAKEQINRLMGGLLDSWDTISDKEKALLAQIAGFKAGKE